MTSKVQEAILDKLKDAAGDPVLILLDQDLQHLNQNLLDLLRLKNQENNVHLAFMPNSSGKIGSHDKPLFFGYYSPFCLENNPSSHLMFLGSQESP